MSNSYEQIKHDIFISYRREGGDILAKLLYETLRHRRYSVFFDHESLSSGVFGEKILETIRNVKDVIVVLSKNCLERCKNNDDWMYREISEAIGNNKNIILVFSEDFEHPSQQELFNYPQEIQTLLKYQGHLINVEHFENILKKLSAEFISQPLSLDDSDIKSAVSFLLNDGINMLSDEQINGLEHQILSSRYGAKLSDILSSFIASNTKHYKNIRPRFRYEISIDSRFAFNNIDIDEENYFKLSETLSYQKYFLEEGIGQDFWISFIQDLDKLDDSLRDETFIFSENLLMDKNDLIRLSKLSEEEQMNFFCKNMRVRFNLNGNVITPTKLIINDTGIFANYQLVALNTSDKNIMDVKLAFSIPHRKVSSYFFASISDPTYSPYIRLDYPEDEIDVEMIPFMNRSTTAGGAKIFDGLRELSFEDEWVLPMSGAVFMINPHI